MSIISSYTSFWGNCLKISGRTNRFDFWFPLIVNAVIFAAALGFIQGLSPFVAKIVWIIFIIANVTSMMRRLRDAGFSVLWTLFCLLSVGGLVALSGSLLPFASAGAIVPLIMCLFPSK